MLILSGRLFVRNLSYLSTESDLKTLFDEYGTLTELILPIDETTDKPKGFCFVEYQMPENAVKALNALDGTIFMGRILHILPGKERDKPAFTQPRVDKSANTSYKKEKLAKMKENATTGISRTFCDNLKNIFRHFKLEFVICWIQCSSRPNGKEI